MKFSRLIAVLLLAGVTTGCGLVLGTAIALDPAFWFGDPLGQNLVATNDPASGGHVLVGVQFLDVATHAVVHEEAIRVLPGQGASANVPPGVYELVGLYDDGYADPGGPQQSHTVDVGPDLDAHVSFTHP